MTQTMIMGIALLMFGTLYILLANQAEVITATAGYMAGGLFMVLGIAGLFAKQRSK